MLSTLFRQFTASCGVVFRTIRAFFSRQLYGVVARVKSVTSLTRQAAKLAPAMLKTATTAGKKPTKREDYIETKGMFISKSFLLLLAVAVVGLAVLIYLVIWPWLVRQFFTARMWSEDKDAADYTGKVVLYYDKEKTSVRREGRLEEGVLQGRGSDYDENGLLVYSGEYIDGVYSGEGKLYDKGALIYEGTFADGLYEGEGRLYENEMLLYEGAFAQGLYDGEGALYEAGETLLYQGGFSAGLRHGEGTAYEDGKRCYKGAFEADLYHGEGVQYAPDGSVVYRGGFSEGLYAGAGTLTLEDGVTLQAEFEEGRVLGSARYFLDGKLYYEGDTAGLLPEGTGSVYNAAGEVVYTGPMKDGALDGGALLGRSAGEIRELLQGMGSESAYDTGFAITARELGLTTFCSFAQKGMEPTVYHVYFFAPDQEQPFRALLWDSAAEFEQAALDNTDAPEVGDGGTGAPDFPWLMGMAPYCQTYEYEGYTLSLWSMEEGGELLAAVWSLKAAMPQVSTQAPSSDGEDRLTSLMGQLGLEPEQPETPEEEPDEEQPQSAYYGGKDVAELLAAVPEEETGVVVSAMLSYLAAAEERTAGEENLALYRQLLAEEQALASTGQGDELAVSQLEETIAALEVRLMENTVQMRKEERTVEDAAGLALGDYDLPGLLVFFDVSTLNIEALGRAVLDEAERRALEEALALLEEQEAGEEETPAEGEASAEGEAPAEEEEAGELEGATLEDILGLLSQDGREPQVEPVDQEALLRDLEDRVLELELAYQQVLLSRQSYETAATSAQKASLEYALGTMSRGDLLTAQIGANEKRAGLYAALTAFTGQAAALNEASGGWLAAEYGWLAEQLGPQE